MNLLQKSCQLENCMIISTYDPLSGYVPSTQEIYEEKLEGTLKNLSLRERDSILHLENHPITAKEIVLRKCRQTEPISFETCYSESVLLNCQKIGEGVYGEVFLFKNQCGSTSIIKVIPIEGDLLVNGERQKKFEEILSEIVISMELSNLRNNESNNTSLFTEVQQVRCVQGRYPPKLLDMWDLFDETRGSENDCPDIFNDEQLYIVFELGNAGKDLEAYLFTNAQQALAMFKQVAFALAVAEEELHFEHRDLHWGNVLLKTVDRNETVTIVLNGEKYEIETKGVQATIIDFTLSRMEYDGVVIYNDLSLDPELFTAAGDYQFDIYRLMKNKNGNNWQIFEPYTNILWLHYILDKSVGALRYKTKNGKLHKQCFSKLKKLANIVETYKSAKDFVLDCLMDISSS